MRKLLLSAGLALALVPFLAAAAAAQGDCLGTSGSATVNGNPWTATCVLGATAPDCVDSLGTEYECFEVVGISTDTQFQSVSIFLTGPPAQGMTYGLGGTSGNGAMVVGGAGFFITADAPYTGEIQVTRYESAGGIIECNFSFEARSLFGPGSAVVSAGQFAGRLVPVAPVTWSTVKNRYR